MLKDGKELVKGELANELIQNSKGAEICMINGRGDVDYLVN